MFTGRILPLQPILSDTVTFLMEVSACLGQLGQKCATSVFIFPSEAIQCGHGTSMCYQNDFQTRVEAEVTCPHQTHQGSDLFDLCSYFTLPNRRRSWPVVQEPTSASPSSTCTHLRLLVLKIVAAVSQQARGQHLKSGWDRIPEDLTTRVIRVFG